MARRPRLEIRDGIYHVYSRGNRRAKIFLDEEDYEAYVYDLNRLSRAHGVRVLAFCLMPNHPHQGLQFTDDSLSTFMHRLNLCFAKRFNRKYGVSGRLFESRYHAQLIDSSTYLSRLVRYIHLNPVRAGLVASPHEWPYSSHLAYLRQAYPFVRTREVRRRLGGDAGYLRWMTAEHDPDADRDLFGGAHGQVACSDEPDRPGHSHLEDPPFNLSGGGILNPGPWTRELPRVSIMRAAVEVAARAGATLGELASARTCEPTRTARRFFAAELRRRGYHNSDIASILNRDPTAAARLIARAERVDCRAAARLIPARSAPDVPSTGS